MRWSWHELLAYYFHPCFNHTMHAVFTRWGRGGLTITECETHCSTESLSFRKLHLCACFLWMQCRMFKSNLHRSSVTEILRPNIAKFSMQFIFVPFLHSGESNLPYLHVRSAQPYRKDNTRKGFCHYCKQQQKFDGDGHDSNILKQLMSCLKI